MIAPNSVVFSVDPHRSVSDADAKNVARNAADRPAVDDRREHAGEDAEHERVDVEQARHEHEREEARDDEVLDRVDAEHLQRVELLADLARAEVGRDRRARDAGQHDRRHERRELADRREHEEAAEPVQRAEQHEEVRRLQPRRAVAERDRRDEQRKPAQLQREEELVDELAAVRIRRPQRGHDRPARQDHHVSDLFEHALRRKERSIGDVADHQAWLPLIPPGAARTGAVAPAYGNRPASASAPSPLSRLPGTARSQTSRRIMPERPRTDRFRGGTTWPITGWRRTSPIISPARPPA